MIRAIIFDCFGVLASEGWLAFVANNFSHDDQAAVRANDAMKAMSLGYISPAEFLTTISELSGKTPAAIREHLYHNLPDEALFSFIKRHKAQYKYGVLSNISVGRLETIFSKEQLALFADKALSYEIGVAKPDPNAYFIAAERLGVLPEECLFVDDQAKNVRAAQQLGMKGVVYENFPQFKNDATKLLSEG